MLKTVKRWLSSDRPPSQDRDPVSLAVAVCVILMEAAQADNEFTGEERDHVIQTLQVRFTLSPEEAHELMEISGGHRDASLDLWKFTNRINEALSREDKNKVLLEVWRVIHSDGALHAHEDYLVHQLARLMNLSHTELIAAKVAARQDSTETG
ncbi:MAG: TerB family tellurite resistance protein [Desulfobacteraceae bacterium]|nr:MAG: TerB family tellurite resistance protein [Desulfobacteraceae bacterium]